MQRVLGLFLACAAFTAAHGHPHEDVDQQVLLSVGTGEVVVQIRIAPSYTEGAAIFAHIDTDGDGAVSEAEAAAFGSAVIGQSALTVDGMGFRFNTPKVSVPDREWVSAGFGLIEIDTTAPINLTSAARHRLEFEIWYGELAHDWFIQPFYFPELTGIFPSQSIGRSSSGRQVRILFRPDPG